MTQNMTRQPLPPSEPIPPGFGPATPPWVWKVTYGVIGMLVGALIVSGAVIVVVNELEKSEREHQCWDPPQPARTWAYPKVVPQHSNRAPLVCARRADNNDGVIPYAHRCLRMVPCEVP